ncbi:MAG: shikimate kinase, partial [Gammaproteobacteria bacterium]
MKRRRDNIFLVGPMGAGKTTIGKRVAEELGLTFYDLDNEIESRTGADVRLIFDIEGEDGFRKRETAMLEDLTSRTGVLVATGGGAVLAKENRRQLIRNGTVVYLHVPLE